MSMFLDVTETEQWFDEEAFYCKFVFSNTDDGVFHVDGKLKIVAEVDVLEVMGKLDVPEVSEEATQGLSDIQEYNYGTESIDLLMKTQQVMDVNGFQILPYQVIFFKNGIQHEYKRYATIYVSLTMPDQFLGLYTICRNLSVIVLCISFSLSQVNSVSRIFEKHPGIASEFRPKNRHLRSAYMNFLLGLIQTLCQPPQELSKDDLGQAHVALVCMMYAGFKVDWLEKKLDQVWERKKKEGG